MMMDTKKEKESLYTSFLTDQNNFLKSELVRKQTTIESLVQLLMQTKQSRATKQYDLFSNPSTSKAESNKTGYSRNLFSVNSSKLFIDDSGRSTKDRLLHTFDMIIAGELGDSLKKFEKIGCKLITSDIGDY